MTHLRKNLCQISRRCLACQCARRWPALLRASPFWSRGPVPAQDVTADAALVKQARVIHAQGLVLDADVDIVIPSTSGSYLAEFVAMACGIGPVSGCHVKPAASCAT